MRELWGDINAPLASRRHRPLPVQCLWSLLQDERTKQTFNQAQATTGECKIIFINTIHLLIK